MGAIAEEFADVAVVTDDNPRTEEPRAIINDILAGMLDAGYAKVMEGRAEAVTCAVMQAKENDVVLVAGKGHEGLPDCWQSASGLLRSRHGGASAGVIA